MAAAERPAGPFAAPAKVNLYLRVTGRCRDGYHALDSLALPVTLADRLWLAAAGSDRLEVEGPFAAALAGTRPQDNLAMRALALARRRGWAKGAFHVRLEKNIPVAAGLGGGSADAAALLWALTGRRGGEVAAAAGALGADVAACLAGAPVLVAGAGERLARAPKLPPFALVLAHPGRPLSTARVFAHRRGPFSPSRPLRRRLPDLERLAAALAWRGNDLTAPARALEADVDAVLHALARQQGVALAAMSGSGATCFGLVASPAQARRGARDLARRHPGWWTAAALPLAAAAPCAGAGFPVYRALGWGVAKR